jgi:hypothetical protein
MAVEQAEDAGEVELVAFSEFMGPDKGDAGLLASLSASVCADRRQFADQGPA